MKKKQATARWTVLVIPTYTRYPSRKLPSVFKQAWRHYYPDTLDDLLGGPKKDIDYDAIILENEHLRITILPELGGKIWSVFDKRAGEDSIYTPDVIKPGLVGLPGAWIPGGMEFNFPVGHQTQTMKPLPCAIIEKGPEITSAVIHRTCNRTGMRMDVTVTLAAGEARFGIHYRLWNPTSLAHRWYHWTNVGVLASPGWQFISKAEWNTTSHVINPYPVDYQGRDTSFQLNRHWPSDSFMIGLREDFFGYYDHDRKVGIAHVAPWQKVAGKKYFTWGTTFRDMDPGALFSDAGHSYLEIQAGPFQTQQDYEIMQPGDGVEFSTTWIPYHETGGIDWADRDMIFQAESGKAALFPAKDCRVELSCSSRTFSAAVKAGRPVFLPFTVNEGDDIELRIDGDLRRRFRFPLKGRQDPDALKKARKKYKPHPPRKPRTAREWHERAKLLLEYAVYPAAIRCFRKALDIKPGLMEARLTLADALWHIGYFDEGEAELQKLLDTPVEPEARLRLSRRKRAEAEFMAPVVKIPDAFAQKLALAERYAGYGGFEKAAAIYRKLSKERPGDSQVNYGLASYYRFITKNRKKTLKYARAALEAQAGDRDLVIELTPFFQWAARHEEALEILRSAPPAVRNMPFCRKMLAASLFETGKAKEALDTYRRHKIFCWEGEYEPADIYREAAVALAEDALAAGEVRAAHRALDIAAVPPKTMYMHHRPLSAAAITFWRGLAFMQEGRPEKARETWAGVIDSMIAEAKEIEKTVLSDFWFDRLREEEAFSFGMCARLCKNPALEKKAKRFIDRWFRLLDKYKVFRLESLPAYREAVRAIFAGDLEAARKQFRKHLKTEGRRLDTARRHLAALKKGKPRGLRFAE